MNKPLVSICCVTYNHASFIRQCLDSFLMQQLSLEALPCRDEYEVGFEILIHDDCSTDETTEIIKEYAAKYPNLIFPLYETENQFCKPGRESMDFYNFRRAQGKYIATCEGDDYWTDPLKLQKQVDFMEAHPDYSVCFHTFRNHVVQTDEYLEPAPAQLLRENGNLEGLDIDVKTYFAKWYTQQLTMLFRRSSFSFDWQKQYKYYRDTHEIYHLLKMGKCRLMNFDGGIRNMHEGGVASLIPTIKAIENSLVVAQELYDYNHDQYTKQNLIDTIKWAMNYSKPFSCNRWKYSARLFVLRPNIVDFCKNLVRKGY